jgi:hypothetical protein
MESQERKRRPRKVWILSAIGVAVVAAAVIGVFAAQNARGNGSAKGKGK